MANQFRWFAKVKSRNSSPFYESLSLKIAEDKELLSSLTCANEPVPNILFGAVHFLLLKGVQSKLAAFYPSLLLKTPLKKDPYPFFRSFFFDNKAEIQEIISSKLVQTNEIQRCSYLYPAFCLISSMVPEKKLTLVEIGASAGLNLIFDHYSYNYGGKNYYGDQLSTIQINSLLKGGKFPDLSQKLSSIRCRIGIDLNPIHYRDSEAILWLRALVWPEHTERANLLLKALEVVKNYPIKLIKGDAVKILPELLSQIPHHTVPCIFHTLTINQFSEKKKGDLFTTIKDYSLRRTLFHISCEWQGANYPELELIMHKDGIKTKRLLAYCDLHGRWIEWLH